MYEGEGVSACVSRNTKQTCKWLANEHDSKLKCKYLDILSPSDKAGKIAWLLFELGNQLVLSQRPFLP